jgi:uncharacterized protein (TIGR02231 family)
MTQHVHLAIEEVAVSEDRAQVRRSGRVALEAGTNQVVVDGVSPLLVDKTLGVSVSAGTVSEVRVERRRRIARPALPEEVRVLDERIERATAERTALFARVGHLREQVERHGEAGDMAAAEIAQDAAWGDATDAAWAARMMAGRDAAWAVAEALVRTSRQVEKADEALADLRARRALLDDPGSEMGARVIVVVDGAPAGDATVALEYVVPSACWRPVHRARLTEGSSTVVAFETGAAVWQHTGEDWKGVRLALSTERPSLGESPPELVDDWLTLRPTGSQVAVEAREAVVQTSGLGAEPNVLRELPGIDDGGEARFLKPDGTYDVPTDGRMVHVPIAAFRVPARVERIVMGELVPAVLAVTDIHNSEREPILPGPVELVRAGGIAGRTTVGLVAAGERFRLGWGPDRALRVTREEDEEELEDTLLGWRRTRRTIVLRISNLGPDAAPIEVTERIPVSEIDKVEIELERGRSTSGSAGVPDPDGDGFLRWTRTVAPYGRDRITVSYVTTTHPDVTL